MADKYERLPVIKARAQIHQGDYLYAPIANQSALGVVKGSDTINIVNGEVQVNLDVVKPSWWEFEGV